MGTRRYSRIGTYSMRFLASSPRYNYEVGARMTVLSVVEYLYDNQQPIGGEIRNREPFCSAMTSRNSIT